MKKGDVLNSAAAAKLLGISKSHLYRLVNQKKVKYSKPGKGKLYFLRRDLENYLVGKLNELDFLSLAEASETTGLSEQTIIGLCKQDIIPNWRRNGEYLFQRGELMIWCEEYRKRGFI